jgi:hypothetical protein
VKWAVIAHLTPPRRGKPRQLLADAAIYPPDVYHRLAAVKRQYGPGNLFTRNHNIRPH